MHAINIMTDVLGEQLSGRTGNEIQLAMQMIADEGRGLIVMLREPSPTTISDLVQRKAAGDGTSRNEIRNYGVGAQILNDLGVNHMILLSNVKRSIVGLDGYGLTIAGYREFDEGNDDHV
jgi:3,4-dihydroxy 2-butanone 4-phosphate synthase/GTP cyclohydrolase II